jgi:hypothetical protein
MPHEHHCQAGTHSGRRQRFHLGGDLRSYLRGYFRPIENPGGHRTSLRHALKTEKRFYRIAWGER